MQTWLHDGESVRNVHHDKNWSSRPEDIIYAERYLFVALFSCRQPRILTDSFGRYYPELPRGPLNYLKRLFVAIRALEKVNTVFDGGAKPRSWLSLSGLTYYHLEATLSAEPVEDLGRLAEVILHGKHPSDPFQELHTCASLFALGEEATPAAYGDMMRRVIGDTFCRQYHRKNL